LGILCGPSATQRFTAEGPDVLPRHFHRRAQVFIRAQRGREQLGLGDGELIRGELRAVEPLGELQHRGVSARLHRAHDGLGALLDGGIE